MTMFEEFVYHVILHDRDTVKSCGNSRVESCEVRWLVSCAVLR